MLLFVTSTRLEKCMDFFDFFFPEQAQATHLRDLARSSNLSRRTSSRVSGQLNDLTELREDMKFLTLVVAAIIKRLSETETMNLSDLQDLLDEIDQLDGVVDGNLEPGVLRGILGMLKEDESGNANDDRDNEEFSIRENIRFR
jgi:hypothetical protein